MNDTLKSPSSTIVEDIATNEEGQQHFVEMLAGRVRKVALSQNLNASQLAKILKIPVSSCSNYWIGKRAWPVEMLPFLAHALNTNVESLVTMRGVHSSALPNPVELEANDLVKVREIDLTFGMGATYLDVPITEETHSFPRDWIRRYTRAAPDMLFFAQGVGDSMEPTLHDSDLLLIDRSQRHLNMADRIWAIAYAECGMVKRLRPVAGGGVEILSDNRAVPTTVAHDGELDIIGRVVAVVKRV